MGGAFRIEPGRAIARCALIVLVPAILDPLIDAAAHVVETERIGQEAAGLQRLLGVVGLVAPLAIGHALLRMVAPPVARYAAAARRVFPLRLARQPVILLR